MMVAKTTVIVTVMIIMMIMMMMTTDYTYDNDGDDDGNDNHNDDNYISLLVTQILHNLVSPLTHCGQYIQSPLPDNFLY